MRLKNQPAKAATEYCKNQFKNTATAVNNTVKNNFEQQNTQTAKNEKRLTARKIGANKHLGTNLRERTIKKIAQDAKKTKHLRQLKPQRMKLKRIRKTIQEIRAKRCNEQIIRFASKPKPIQVDTGRCEDEEQNQRKYLDIENRDLSNTFV